ncbi:ParA family protein [Desulfonema ishimotonii]|uniref:ParA family protein n=1 Tax=Desulfonema ishimotonii TaxID=45657 RepID=A0A401G4K3_9BACT|nr:ParA family protein [Desulfonema ishimotonii]GBC64178.1 ParA family protein [Desulfonema ishimotonii]
MITIAITNQKGGVGKTTISFNLSCILADKFKKRVLVIDNDPQGNLTSSFVDEESGLQGNILDIYDEKPGKPIKVTDRLHLLGANINLASVAERAFPVIFNLKNGIAKLNGASRRHSYDFAIIDCLPSFGHLNLAALVAADYVLIPVKPSPYSLSGMQDLMRTTQKVKKNLSPSLEILGIVINQVEGRKTNLQSDMQEALRENYPALIFKNTITKRIKLEESPLFKKGIINYQPNNPPAEEFVKFVGEFLKKVRQMAATRSDYQ